MHAIEINVEVGLIIRGIDRKAGKQNNFHCVLFDFLIDAYVFDSFLHLIIYYSESLILDWTKKSIPTEMRIILKNFCPTTRWIICLFIRIGSHVLIEGYGFTFGVTCSDRGAIRLPWHLISLSKLRLFWLGNRIHQKNTIASFNHHGKIKQILFKTTIQIRLQYVPLGLCQFPTC